MPDNKENYVNRPAITPNLPKTPVVPLPRISSPSENNSSSPLGGMSLNDYFTQKLNSVKPQGVPDIPLSSFYIGNRYTETRPGTDYEEMAAQQQSSWDKFGNGLAKFVGTAATSFVSGTAGLLYGIGSAFYNQRLASLIDNDVTRGMDQLSRNLEDIAPNYYTKTEQDADWYSPDNILTANFFSDKLIKNLGYSLGAIGGGVAWSKLFQVMGATNALVRVGVGMEAAQKVESAMAAAPKFEKFAEFEKAITSLTQKHLLNPISKGFKDADRILTSTMGTFGEASIEGLQSMNQFRNNAIAEYRDKYGVNPEGKDLEEINKYADKIGMYTWGFNTMLLSGTNYVQLPKILNSSRRAERAMINETEQAILGGDFSKIVPTTKFGKIINGTKGVGKLLFSKSEAFEEGAQYAIQTGVNNYFERGYQNHEDVKEFFKTFGGVVSNVFGEGVSETLGSKEGLESILIGGLSGGLQQSGIIGTYKDEKNKTKFGIGKSGTIAERGLFGQGGERGENTDVAIKALNKTKISDVLTDQAKYLGIAIGSQKLRQDANVNNDKLSEKDFEADYMFSYIMPRVKYGKIDSILNELDYYEKQSMDEDGFNELKRKGIVNKKEKKEQFLQKLNNIKNTAKSIDQIYDVTNDRYGNSLDKTVVDKLVYATAKIRDYQKRMTELNNELFLKNISGQIILDEVDEKGKVSEETLKTIEEEIKKIGGTNDDLKENATNALELGELALLRKSFISEYNNILVNPGNYEEKPVTEAPTPQVDPETGKAKTVKIKTKDGEEDIELGTEYFLGRKVDESAEGFPIFKFPKFTILEELPDGKVKVRADDGRVYDINKSAFTPFKFGKVSDTLNNKKGKFFLESSGKVYAFKRKFPKEPLRGWLEWSDKPNVLLFAYKDSKGVTRSFEVRNEDFVAKPGFEEGLITKVGEMTPTEQMVLQEFSAETQETEVSEVSEKRSGVGAIVNELYTTSKKRIDEISEALDKKRKELEEIQDSFDNLTKTKKGAPRKNITKAARKTLNSLSSLRTTVENDIENLESEKEYLENSIPYFENVLSNLSEAGDEGLFMEELKEEIDVLEKLIDSTNDEISSSKSLIESIDKALTEALSLISDYARRLREENPTLPASLEALQQNIEKFLGEEGAKQFVEQRLGFAQDIIDIEDQIEEFKEELDIPNMNIQIESLQKTIKQTEEKLKKLLSEQFAKSQILESLKEAAEREEEKRKEEEFMQKSTELIKEILGSADSGLQTRGYNTNYESEAKKTNEGVVTSSKPTSSDLPHHKRVNIFGARFPNLPNKDRMRAVLVTSKNEEKWGLNGLTQFLIDQSDVTDEEKAKLNPSETVVLVMAEEGRDGVIRLVGIDGQPLGENPPLENAIFQVFPEPSLQWSSKYVKPGKDNSMFRETTPEATREHYRKEYKKWRDSILESPPTRPFKVEASFGNPIYVTKLNEKGEEVRDFDSVVPVVDAKLIEQSALKGEPVIYVPTTDNYVQKGSTRFDSPLGRPFLSIANAYVKLKNGTLKKKRAQVIYQAIYELSKDIRKNGNAQSDKAKRITNWLKSVVYWNTPRNSTGYNSIFFERTDEGLMLFVSGNGKKYKFTPTNLEDNREELIMVISGMFHNIRYDLVSADSKAEKWKEPYEEFIGFDNNGEPVVKTWANYQTYLLSPQGRSLEELPLFTQMKPVKNEDEETNRKGVYFTIASLQEHYSTPVEPKQVKLQAPPTGAPAAPVAASEKIDGFDFSGKTKNKMPLGNYGDFEFTFDAEKFISSGESGGFSFDVREDVQKKIAEDKGISLDEAEKLVGDSIYTKLLPSIQKYKEQKKKPAEPAPVPTDAKADIKGRIAGQGTSIELEIKGKTGKEFLLVIDRNGKGKIELYSEKKEFPDGPRFSQGEGRTASQEQIRKLYDEYIPKKTQEAINNWLNSFTGSWAASETEDGKNYDKIEKELNKELAALEGTKPAEAPSVEEKKKPTEVITPATDVEITSDEEEEMRKLMDEEDDDPLFRKKIVQEINRFETENWKKAEAWLKKNFPNIPVYRVKNIIQSTNGDQAWGMFKNGAIYIYENAEVGSIYHEVFESVWKMFSDENERLAVKLEFKNRKGSFIDRPTQEVVKYSEATDDQIREQLAEEFRDYVLYKKIPAKPNVGKPWIVKLFSDLVSFIKTFFTGEKAQVNTANLFEKIGTGYYKQHSPYSSSLAFAKKGFIEIEEAFADSSSVFRIKNIPANEVNDIMQHMTYLTLYRLMSTNRGLFNFEKVPREQLYEEISKDLQKRILKPRKETEIAIKEGTISPEKGQEKIAKSISLWKKVTSEWEEIKKKHEEYLKTYDVEFDENEEAQIVSDERTKESGWGDSTKVDSFRKANSAIKLLLSTLPMMDSTGKPLESSIYGYKLMPTSKVYMAVMNNVHTSLDIDDMLKRVHDMAKDDVNYRLLYDRLTGKFNEEDITDISSLEEVHDGQLLASFWRTFKKQNPDVKNVYIFENGDIQVADSNLSTAARQVRSEYVNNLIKIVKGKNDYFVFDPKEKVFVGKKDSVKNIELKNDEERIKFLESLGIVFNINEVVTLPTDKQEAFRKAVAGIKKSIQDAEKIISPGGKSLEISNRLMALSLIRAYINNPEFDSTFFNVKGERTQNFLGTNAASDLYDVLSQVESLDQLIGTQYEYLVTDSFAKHYVDKQGNKIPTSVILGNIFNYEDKNGKRIAGSNKYMKTAYADGTVDTSTGKRVQSAKLTYKQRLIQEINLNIAGYYYNLVPGDASIQWMMYMGNHVSADNLLSGYGRVHEIFKGYFISELLLSKENRRIEGKNRKSKDLRFLKPILGEKLQNDILTDYNEFLKQGKDELDLYERYKGKINAAIESFIQKDLIAFEASLYDYGVVDRTVEGKLDVSKLNFENRKTMEEGDFRRELTALTINFMINNIELHKLLYSDPYQYKDELKRIKNFNSPRQAVASSPKFNKLLNKLWNKPYSNANDIARTDFGRAYLRTVVYSDVKGLSSLKNYGNWDETDGGGTILFKANRNFRIRAGEWNQDEERQYKYDMAWEKRHKQKNLSDKQIKDKGLELSKEEQDLLDKGNPGITSAYTPIKPIVSGRKLNDKSYNDVVLDKFSLYPISYRIMYEIAKTGKKDDINALKLYDKMQSEDIDYVIFDSGRKVGVEELNPVYNEDGSFNTDPFIGVTNIPFSIISIQSEVPSKETYTVTRGSQATKLAKLDFQQAGVPIDFMANEPNFNKRYKAWEAMSKEERRSYNNGDNLYKTIQENQELLEALTEDGYNELLKKLGIKQVKEGDTLKFVIEDFKKAEATLREEIMKREVNDNMIDALDGFLDGDVVIEATPAYQQIRNILYSIADKNVISQKTTGGMKVQIYSTFMEDKRVGIEEINGKKGYTSDVLKFYESEDKQVCEIMVGRWFDSPLSDEELLDLWYKKNDDGSRSDELTDEGRKALSGIGFRIPTQKQNSIDAFVIKQFLPKEFGDSVVIPSALVRKVGSDFDIDKLSIYLKNVFVRKNGVPKTIEFLTDKNSTPEKRYIIWVKENSNRDTRRYVKFLSRQAVNELKDNFEKTIEEIRSKYQISKEEGEESLFQEMLEYTKTTLDKQLSEQDSYMKKLFNTGSKVFWRMSDDTRDPFWEVKNDIRNKGIKGPEEIRRYLSLAVSMIEDQNTLEEDVVKLEELVKIYSQELRVMGLGEETIDNVKKEALDKFRANKKALDNTLRLDLSPEFDEAENTYETSASELDLQIAEEIAEKDGLKSFEDFKNSTIYQQNVRKALQNEYVNTFFSLVTNPLNFERLTTPNSAKQLEDLSKEVTKQLGFESFDYSATNNLLSRRFMSRLRHAFVTGKYAIGIAAVNQTNHSLNQATNVYVDPSRLNNVSEQDREYLGDVTIKFADYNKIALKDKTVATLSFRKDALNENFISDIIGQFIDGYVDISKGPWIMELGATPNVTSTWLFLIKIGVPVKQVAYFMNQPIIRDYLREIEKAGYSWLFIDTIRNQIQESVKYSVSEDLVKSVQQIPSTTSLFETIGKKELTSNQKAEQQFILNEFLKYAMMANHMFLVTQGSNFDTATFNDPYLVFKKLEQLKKARKTIISSVDDIIQNSFIKKILEKIVDIREAFSEILKSEHPNIRNVIHDVLRPYTDLSDGEFVKLARTAVNNLFDWAVQTNENFNSEIKSILLSDKNIANEMAEFIKLVKSDTTHPLYNNVALDLIVPHFSDKEDSVQNLKVKNKDNKIYDQNQLISAFRELRTHLEGKNSNLYSNLVKLSVLQSGLTNSPISFTSMLPYEDFKKIYNKTLSTLEKLDNLKDFYNLNVLQRNNWNDDDIVPRRYARYKVDSLGFVEYNKNMNFYKYKAANEAIKNKTIPQLLQLSILAKEADSDVIVYTWEKTHELLSKDELTKLSPYEQRKTIDRRKSEMREKGDMSFINKGLFKKVYITEGNEPLTVGKGKFASYIYKMINPWGESKREEGNYFSANEFYTDGRKSVINNGFLQTTEVSDDSVTVYFDVKKDSDIRGTDEFDKLPRQSNTPTMTYAGVGSRQTPPEILSAMTEAAKYLENQGFRLNTGLTFGGKKEGADKAFSDGVKNINNVYYARPENATERTKTIAKEIHPAPGMLSTGALQLMARNTNQVFGENLDKPVDFVLFYAKETDGIRPEGGTGQAVEMARRKGIPAINMASENWRDELKKVLNNIKEAKEMASTAPVSRNVQVVARYTNADVKANPNKIYVFGDNTQRKGTGGQAEIRNNPNAMGIATKLAPSMEESAFMTDKDLTKNKSVIDGDIAKIKSTGKAVVFPKDGLGTGLAKLKEKAPQTYAYLKQRLLQEFGFDNDNGTIKPQTITLKDGKTYNVSDVNTKMLQSMGYSLEEAGEILKQIC